jgi:hypothetical protein
MFDGVNFVASTRVPRSNPQTFGSAGAGPILERCPTNIGLLWSPKMLNPGHRGVTSSPQTWLDSVKLHPTLQVPNLITSVLTRWNGKVSDASSKTPLLTENSILVKFA